MPFMKPQLYNHKSLYSTLQHLSLFFEPLSTGTSLWNICLFCFYFSGILWCQIDNQTCCQPVFAGKPEGPFCLSCTFIFQNERNWMKKSVRVSEKLVSPGLQVATRMTIKEKFDLNSLLLTFLDCYKILFPIHILWLFYGRLCKCTSSPSEILLMFLSFFQSQSFQAQEPRFKND